MNKYKAQPLMKKFYTLKQVAKRLGVHERTIFRYLKSGKIRGSKVRGWKFTEQDISDFYNRTSNVTYKKNCKHEWQKAQLNILGESGNKKGNFCKKCSVVKIQSKLKK